MKYYFTFILLFFLYSVSLAQEEYGLGLLLDSVLYVNAPVKATLMRGDYNNLPPAYSLKKYCPTPGSQGSAATCAAWSSAYACRTILESIRFKYDSHFANKNAYSPSFVYNQIRSDKSCQKGTSLIDALNVLKAQGGLKFFDFGYDCDRLVTNVDLEKASNNRIIEYREVATKYEGNQSIFVKKSLSENKPVVIAMDVPPSFSNAKELWIPEKKDYKRWSRGHGLAIIGYDDNKFGGAFEVMNSWGPKWGKDGFCWIKYSDFNYFALLAFELIDQPVKNDSEPDLSGKLSLVESNYEPIRTSFNGEYFVTQNSYVSGTLFELRISNDQPSYVYAFSSDSTFKVNKVFPFHNNMIAYLPYKKNNVAIPSEDSFNELDTVKGKTYFCFLYSKKSIEIDEKLKAIENGKGSLWDRIKTVFSSELIPANKIKYSTNDHISFSAFSSEQTIVPVLIEIDHQ
jgi:hypothetical protein